MNLKRGGGGMRYFAVHKNKVRDDKRSPEGLRDDKRVHDGYHMVVVLPVPCSPREATPSKGGPVLRPKGFQETLLTEVGLPKRMPMS